MEFLLCCSPSSNSFLIISSCLISASLSLAFSFLSSRYTSTEVILSISGFINLVSLNRLPNRLIISKGILGVCSIKRSSSLRQALTNSVPPVVLSSLGKDNSTEIFLLNLEYAIAAAR